MKKLFTTLLIICSLFQISFAQDNYSISLKFHHSQRPSYNSVNIYLNVRQDSVLVRSTVYSLNQETYSINDTPLVSNNFKIDLNSYKEILTKVKLLSADKLLAKSGFGGKDGNQCTISYGNNNQVSFSVWTPNSDTKERGLQEFYLLFKEILEIGKIKTGRVF